MLHGIDIVLTPYIGNCMGQQKTEGSLDIVWAVRNGERSRLGHLFHSGKGSWLSLIRYVKPDLREPIRQEVERLRIEAGGEPIAARTSCVPDPVKVRSYIKGGYKKRKKTIWTPGERESGETEETTEDESDEQ